MSFLFFYFFPFLLFASSECESSLRYRMLNFFLLRIVADPELLKKDPVISENLALPEWMEQTLAAEFATFGSYSR